MNRTTNNEVKPKGAMDRNTANYGGVGLYLSTQESWDGDVSQADAFFREITRE